MVGCGVELKLFPKLALVLAAVALVPVGVFGLLGFGGANDALRRRIEQGHARVAAQAAELAATHLRAVLRTLRQNAAFADFETDRQAVLTGFLRVAYRQSDDISIVSLVNERGRAVAPSVYLEHPEETETLRSHPAVSEEDLEEHGRRIPLEAALASGAAVGPPYGRSGHPRVALAVEVPGQRGSEERRVLVAEVSLESLDEDLREVGGELGEVLLLRPDSRTLRDGQGPLPLPGASLGELPEEATRGVIEQEGRRRLVAFAPVPMLGWGVVARQVEAEALEPLTRLRAQSAFWALVGVLMALLLAALVARDLAGRIGALSRRAQALASGDRGEPVPVESKDELGRLAEAFNKTAHDLEEQRRQIEAKNEEIQRWNRELERRVEEKTDQLARAQEIVLRSRRLAGLGVLGAGVAHEINNPLASSLGFIQLVLRDSELKDMHRQCLEQAETSALRIREIVEELRKLADNESSAAYGEVDLNDVGRRAAQMVQGQLDDERITLTLELDESLPRARGNQQQLVEAVLHLVHNARQAVEGDGRIILYTSHTGNQVVTIAVEDDGSGIAEELLDRVFDPFFTTKGSWEARGLGLSVVHKIAEEHGGQLDLDSEVGRGTTVTLTLPISGGRHLA